MAPEQLLDQMKAVNRSRLPKREKQREVIRLTGLGLRHPILGPELRRELDSVLCWAIRLWPRSRSVDRLLGDIAGVLPESGTPN
jgi:hypothetical protein